jgi:membrane protein implicated in regulation of membrane protease activity
MRFAMEMFTLSAGVLLIIGLIAIALDALVFGWTTIYISLFGLASLLTAGLVALGWLDSITAKLISLALLTTGLSIVFYLLAKKKDNNTQQHKEGLVGYTFYLDHQLMANQVGQATFSGVAWKVTSTEDIAAGTEVEILHVSVGRLTVKKASAA